MSYLIFSRIITGLFLTFVDPSGVHHMMSYLIFSRIITGLFLTFVDPSGVHLLSKPWSRPNHRDDSHKEKKKKPDHASRKK